MKFGICSPSGLATEPAGFDFKEWPLRDTVGDGDAESRAAPR